LLGYGHPHLCRFNGSGIACSLHYAAKLGGDSNVTNEVIVGGYELRVVICNYQIYPITAECRTPYETFTTCVDPVSAPFQKPENRSLKSTISDFRLLYPDFGLVELPGTAPGSTAAYSVTTFSVISGRSLNFKYSVN